MTPGSCGSGGPLSRGFGGFRAAATRSGLMSPGAGYAGMGSPSAGGGGGGGGTVSGVRAGFGNSYSSSRGGGLNRGSFGGGGGGGRQSSGGGGGGGFGGGGVPKTPIPQLQHQFRSFVPAQGGAPLSPSSLSLVDALYDAIVTGDAAGLGSLLADNEATLRAKWTLNR